MVSRSAKSHRHGLVATLFLMLMLAQRWEDEGDNILPEYRCYVDDLSGKILPEQLVCDARAEEVGARGCG